MAFLFPRYRKHKFSCRRPPVHRKEGPRACVLIQVVEGEALPVLPSRVRRT